MAKENQGNLQHQNKQHQAPKEWDKTWDSPIEQAKMHPFLKDAMTACLGIYIFDEIIKQMFMAGVMNTDNWPILKGFVDMSTFALGILVLVAIMVTPTREKEKRR